MAGWIVLWRSNSNMRFNSLTSDAVVATIGNRLSIFVDSSFSLHSRRQSTANDKATNIVKSQIQAILNCPGNGTTVKIYIHRKKKNKQMNRRWIRIRKTTIRIEKWVSESVTSQRSNESESYFVTGRAIEWKGVCARFRCRREAMQVLAKQFVAMETKWKH